MLSASTLRIFQFCRNVIIKDVTRELSISTRSCRVEIVVAPSNTREKRPHEVLFRTFTDLEIHFHDSVPEIHLLTALIHSSVIYLRTRREEKKKKKREKKGKNPDKIGN